jgi:hypothetical protein
MKIVATELADQLFKEPLETRIKPSFLGANFALFLFAIFALNYDSPPGIKTIR